MQTHRHIHAHLRIVGDILGKHEVAPRSHERSENGINDNGLGQRHDHLVEHLKAGSAVHPSRFVQALGDGVEEALGHIVSHAGAGAVDENQSRHGVGSRQPHAAENLIQHDHGDEAREHAQNQAGVHQQLSALEAKPGENIADAQHHKGLQHRRSQGGDQRIAEPNGEARFGPQIDVVVKAPLLGDDVAHTSGGFSPEGLQQDACKGR